MKEYPTISELSWEQKGHLAWRLHYRTAAGYFISCRIANGEYFPKDEKIDKVFEIAGMSKHASKINATKVISYKCGEKEYDNRYRPSRSKFSLDR